MRRKKRIGFRVVPIEKRKSRGRWREHVKRLDESRDDRKNPDVSEPPTALETGGSVNFLETSQL
jgi:hypothetical protein